ncbi:hypothetical protein [Cupriavidus sp. USMAA2-4]|uniref:hypothetical protein n=1 Tax=Cupriavidus sp. USMAA2-4 TaxID=876364 RepID=UPI0018DB4951|nr:hypothetical protein [Cupriavidus sp. USMAA2-4]
MNENRFHCIAFWTRRAAGAVAGVRRRPQRRVEVAASRTINAIALLVAHCAGGKLQAR